VTTYEQFIEYLKGAYLQVNPYFAVQHLLTHQLSRLYLGKDSSIQIGKSCTLLLYFITYPFPLVIDYVRTKRRYITHISHFVFLFDKLDMEGRNKVLYRT